MTERRARFLPLASNWKLRVVIGAALAALSPIVGARLITAAYPGIGVVLAFLLVAWLPATFLTDKYRHKYPQRYYPYLIASHFKAATIMLLAILLERVVLGPNLAPLKLLALSVVLFTVADAAVSALRRRAPVKRVRPLGEQAAPKVNGNGDARPQEAMVSIDSGAILAGIDSQVSPETAEFIRQHLPESEGTLGRVLVLDDIPLQTTESGQAALLVASTPLNHVSRLNLFLDYCTRRLAMGGYIVVTYKPLEAVNERLRERFPGPLYYPAFGLHFLWYRAIPKLPWLDKVYFSPQLAWLDKLMLRAAKQRNRVLSKAEVWGRLAFYGMEVRAERVEGDTCTVIAQRVSPAVTNRRPSYYAIVGLQKVALDGEIIRLHKVRSMYPFSEFLQKAIFEKHGLTATGKFNDDFRITEYGKLFRRHWIDELPGVFDWLRGDIKLVGMRATSPHFLSLYGPEFFDLYVQVKPGLVPPIFDESTGGFEQIVETERIYLTRYMQAPVKTDILYFWYTFRDIFLRKVRSK